MAETGATEEVAEFLRSLGATDEQIEVAHRECHQARRGILGRDDAGGLIMTHDPETFLPITDDELTALALAADPDQPIDADAVPLAVFLAQDAGPLPEWYMAPVMARHSGRRRKAVILSVVGSFLLIEAFGLCSTYGQWPFH